MGEVVEDVPGIGISYSVQVGDGKNVVFQTAVSRDGPEITAVIDKLQAAADRAILYSKIESAESSLEHDEHQVRVLVSNLEEVAQKYHDRASAAANVGRSRPVIPAGEIQAKENAEKSLEMHKQGAARWEAKLAAFRAKLGV